MTQFSYRLALTTMVLAISLAVWWSAAAAAKTYIDRPGTGGSIGEVAVAPAGEAGFDWLDAGIGAAATSGFGLLVGGAWVLVLRNRRSTAFS